MSKNSNEQDAKKTGAAAQLSSALRLAAEKQLASQPHSASTNRPLDEALHDLEVQKIELKMQNEELRRAQSIIEESRERYVDFYDFAPVGYITLGRDASIEEINLTGATLLGDERSKLLHNHFAHYVAPEDRERWQRHFAAAMQHDKKLTCELAILNREGTHLQVQLDSLRLLRADRVPVMRISMIDITERKRAEDTMREQEEFFRMITENIEDFIAVLDLQGRRL